MRGWGITNVKNTRVEIYGGKLIANIPDNDRQNPDQPIYWVAPEVYLGNKVSPGIVMWIAMYILMT